MDQNESGAVLYLQLGHTSICKIQTNFFPLFCIAQFEVPTSNNIVSFSILNNLEDLTACGQPSWGSVVLAMLYRNLCKATLSNANKIGGRMYTLKLWAWCKITTIAPKFLYPFDNKRPYGAMYELPKPELSVTPRALDGPGAAT
ncbi:hypothetical protein R6Q59_031439 [Mikania micrantha]